MRVGCSLPLRRSTARFFYSKVYSTGRPCRWRRWTSMVVWPHRRATITFPEAYHMPAPLLSASPKVKDTPTEPFGHHDGGATAPSHTQCRTGDWSLTLLSGAQCPVPAVWPALQSRSRPVPAEGWALQSPVPGLSPETSPKVVQNGHRRGQNRPQNVIFGVASEASGGSSTAITRVQAFC